MSLVKKASFPATIFCLIVAGPSLASDNQLFLLQESGASGGGNELTIDQREAQGSRIAGISSDFGATSELTVSGARSLFDEQNPLMQRGNNNVGEVTMAGSNGIALFSQQGRDEMDFGSGNRGIIEVFGNNSVGILTQFGDNNQGAVRISADDSAGTLIQRGNSNNLDLSVRSPDTAVVFEQNGDNLGSGDGEAVEVFRSGGGDVLITQTQF